MVSALNFQAGYRGFESRSGRDNFQTIITPNSYSTCPGLSIKWTGRRLVTDSGTKCAWVIHASKAVQIMYIITIAAASMCLGCLVALKIRTTTTTIVYRYVFGMRRVQTLSSITLGLRPADLGAICCVVFQTPQQLCPLGLYLED